MKSAVIVFPASNCDRDAAVAKLPAFLVDFKNLERAMAGMSEKIENQARVTRDASESMVAFASRNAVPYQSNVNPAARAAPRQESIIGRAKVHLRPEISLGDVVGP